MILWRTLQRILCALRQSIFDQLLFSPVDLATQIFFLLADSVVNFVVGFVAVACSLAERSRVHVLWRWPL
jgi:hypothetical protein